MVGEHLSSEASPATGPFLLLAECEPKSFRQLVRETTRPIVRRRWFSPLHHRLVGFVRHHLNEIVEDGGITSAPLQAALVEELGYQFSEPSDVNDMLDDYDLRETEGGRPWIGVIGRFALLASRFHYYDPQIMLRPLQLLLAPDKLAHAMGRSMVMDAYDNLHGREQDDFEVYEGPISRWQALRWGMPQAAVLGAPTVTAIRQRSSPVTLTWVGDETRPNLTVFAPRASTRLISRWQDRDEKRAA
jgi:hypothetical protein